MRRFPGRGRLLRVRQQRCSLHSRLLRSLPAAAASPTASFRTAAGPRTRHCSVSHAHVTLSILCRHLTVLTASSQDGLRLQKPLSLLLCKHLLITQLCPEFAAIPPVLRLHLLLLLLQLPPPVQALPLGGLEPSDRPRGLDWLLPDSCECLPGITKGLSGREGGETFSIDFAPIHQRNHHGSDSL